MVGKPTGRPRGRPRKPPKPRKNVGRPKLLLRNDPDRYALAIIDTMLALKMGNSERDCAIAIAAVLVGVEGPPKPSPDRYHEVTNWELFKTKIGSTAATLEGMAATLRAKRKRYNTDADLIWRTAMRAAFGAVFTLPEDQGISDAMRAAAMVGESDFAQRVLRPMARKSPNV